MGWTTCSGPGCKVAVSASRPAWCATCRELFALGLNDRERSCLSEENEGTELVRYLVVVRRVGVKYVESYCAGRRRRLVRPPRR